MRAAQWHGSETQIDEKASFYAFDDKKTKMAMAMAMALVVQG